MKALKAKQDKQQVRKRYSPEFKKQVLDRAEKEGVATVAKDLGMRESQLYAWRQKRRLEGLTTEEEKLQQGEIARLKREMVEAVKSITEMDGRRKEVVHSRPVIWPTSCISH
jgi:transposase